MRVPTVSWRVVCRVIGSCLSILWRADFERATVCTLGWNPEGGKGYLWSERSLHLQGGLKWEVAEFGAAGLLKVECRLLISGDGRKWGIGSGDLSQVHFREGLKTNVTNQLSPAWVTITNIKTSRPKPEGIRLEQLKPYNPLPMSIRSELINYFNSHATRQAQYVGRIPNPVPSSILLYEYAQGEVLQIHT